MKNINFLIGVSLLLFSCKTDSINAVDSDNTIQYKETVSLPGSSSATLTFAEVEDSRCPEGVTCIRAGSAIVDLDLKNLDLKTASSFSESQRVTMCLGDCITLTPRTGFREADTAKVSLAGTTYTLILTEVLPYPNTSKPVEKKDYAIKLKIQ